MTPQRQFAVEVVERLKGAGYQAYWAGGCVRDALLGLAPKDYDVATDARPEQIRAVFGRRRTLAIGAAFGVITVVGSKRQGQIEIATFRQDAAYSDGRHPDSVTFSTPQQDAARRDFTINGMFFDPLEDQVIDYVGGQEDLRRQIVRAIGDADARIDEDKLRMLRAVRFAATYEFELEDGTLQALRRHAAELSVVSAERVAEEMRRMLAHASRAKAVGLLHSSGLLAVILPEFSAVAKDAEAFQRTLLILDRLGEGGTFPSALAALLRETAGASSKTSREVAQRWRLSKDEAGRTRRLLRHEADVLQARQIPWPQLQRILIADGATELIDYCEAIAHVLEKHIDEVAFCRAQLALPPSQLNPDPLITGDDLRAAGIPAGKVYRELLDAVRDAQLEGRVDSRDAALQYALDRWRREP